MYSTLHIDNLVFDTWAIQKAYSQIGPEKSSTEDEYDEQSFRTFLELFCDWGPIRASSFNDLAANSLNSFSESEKRDLYQRGFVPLLRRISRSSTVMTPLKRMFVDSQQHLLTNRIRRMLLISS